jgi:hypothetical protein
MVGKINAVDDTGLAGTPPWNFPTFDHFAEARATRPITECLGSNRVGDIFFVRNTLGR